MSTLLDFECVAEDPCGARAGLMTTRRGVIETPVFMPVGTAGTVKGVGSEELESLGASIILGNAYHLWVRPGAERIAKMGGLHRFMSWSGSILTDSGGFQAMSLAHLRRMNEEGVHFRSHLDGEALFMSPEESIRIQRLLGSDIMMVLDECPALPAPQEVVAAAVDRTTRWARRCLDEWKEGDGALFGIVQGGSDPELRERSTAEITAMPFHGFALGGLSVGEGPETTWRVVGESAKGLPAAKPRYLMGVGRPEDFVECVHAGIDMFDCVLPTRNARNGTLFTRSGPLNIKGARFAEDMGPIEEGCTCSTCARYSRAYVRHLYLSKEILVNRLTTVHNLHHVLQLMSDMREAILEGRFEAFRRSYWAGRGQPLPTRSV